MSLGIDAGHWTRISKGEAHFPQEKLNALMDFCGNEVPLIWLADRRGYELKPLMTSLEKENAELRAKIAEQESLHAHTIQVLKEIQSHDLVCPLLRFPP